VIENPEFAVGILTPSYFQRYVHPVLAAIFCYFRLFVVLEIAMVDSLRFAVKKGTNFAFLSKLLGAFYPQLHQLGVKIEARHEC